MAIRITHVRFGSTGKTEDEIVRYRWVSDETGKVGENDKPALVDWIDVRGGEAYVTAGGADVSVRVVRLRTADPYLRTYADGIWTNNLVNLDKF